MSGTYIGVDIGGTRVKVARVVGTDVEARTSIALAETPQTPDALVRAIAQAVKPMATDADGLGVGVAALVDSEQGQILNSPNLPWLNGFAVTQALKKATGLNSRVDNDVNCIGWGEASAGVAVGASDVVCLALGTGLGGAIIRNGKLLRGASGRAAELGHIAVDPNGPLCGCGGRGCAEQYASKTGVLRLAKLVQWQPAATTKDKVVALFRAAEAGDPKAKWVVDEAGRALGLTVLWCWQTLNPQKIVLAGGVATAWPQLQPAALLAIARHLPPHTNQPLVVQGTLGQDAGTIGAAQLFNAPTKMSR